MTAHTEPPRGRVEPLSPPARPQPRRLVPVGRGGVRARASASTSRSCSASATRRATGATSWSASRSRTRRSPQLMNEHFVSIKVDREERPDLDQIYMNAVQLLTGRGGWPMTVFLTPDGKPFYGGTYFPPEDRHGLPGFPRLLLGDRAGVSRASPTTCRTPCGDVHGAAAAARERTQPGDALPGAEAVREAVAAARARLRSPTTAASARRRSFPNTSGASTSSCAPRTHRRPRYPRWRCTRCASMARGRHLRSARRRLPSLLGRRALAGAALREDALRQRPARAAVPRRVPAHRRCASSRASRARRSTTSCARCAIRTAASTRRRTPTARARRASSSSGTSAEVLAAARRGRAARSPAATGTSPTHGNFEHRNILHVTLDGRAARRSCSGATSPTSRGQLADGARHAVRGARAARQAGARQQDAHRWNGLMISAFAKAAELLRRAALPRRSRVDAVAFVERELQRGERLLSTWKDGVAKLNGYLDDYAFFAAALLDLFEAVQERRYLDQAARADGHDDRALLGRRRGRLLLHQRRPRGADRAQQAGLRRLDPVGQLGGRDDLPAARTTTPNATTTCERAETVLRLFAEPMRAQPFGFANMLRRRRLSRPRPVRDRRRRRSRRPPTRRRSSPACARATSPTARCSSSTHRSDAAARRCWRARRRSTASRRSTSAANRTCSPPATAWGDIEPPAARNGSTCMPDLLAAPESKRDAARAPRGSLARHRRAPASAARRERRQHRRAQAGRRRALEEMRGAFEMFAPYRGIRKVADLRLGAHAGERPLFRAAEEFARAIAEPASWSSPAPAAASWKPASAAPGASAASASTSACRSSRRANPIIHGDPKLRSFNYFFTRKLFFVLGIARRGALPRRLRHPRRGVRDPHAAPDRQVPDRCRSSCSISRAAPTGRPGSATSRNTCCAGG